MSNTPHELAEEFPEHVEKMHRLKAENAHFAKLFDEYHEVNRAIHRAETDVEPTDDAHMEEMRKSRMALKDEIYALLKA
ncbi:YdcH family protein [Amorphus sp. 3PC139-8]|uniref:YdcH family protein n=1 Tax=Amorphus sp. 3PC139-8 TaxID=2735676 RepID=UPI00345DDBEA